MSKKTLLYLLISLILWGILYWNLQSIVNYFIDDLLGLSPSHFTSSLRFFVYEVPKVLLLLLLIIFTVGIIQSFFSAEKTRQKLEGKPLFVGNVMAAFLGILTPFCSCSAIPLFLGFVEAGIPIGVTFSFLIAAPMINEVALVLLVGLVGWKVAVIYVATGLFVAIFAGYTIEKLKLQKYVADWVFQMQSQPQQHVEEKITLEKRIQAGITAVKEIIGKIWLYIIIGIAIGAGVHGYVPEDYLTSLLGQDKWYAIPLAILVGIPLYSNAAGIVPIVSVLIEKGVSLGTALAFMMSVIGLSLPEIIILKKILKWQLIVIFVAIVTVGILFVGYLFNSIL